MLSVVLLS